MLVAMAGSVLLGTPPAHATATATATDQVEFSVTVDEIPLERRPIVLIPAEPVRLAIKIRNSSERPTGISSVRMSGSVLGLTFFAYDTAVAWVVPAGGEGTWTLDIPMDDLAGQATGLLPIEVALRGEDRETVVSVDGVADVRGSVVSTYGMFASGVAAVTAILWAAGLLALARHRLPVHRWRRAVRFVPAGAGLGLVVIIGFSALRFTAPTGSSELGFLIAATATAFLFGYLTPTPRELPPVQPAPVMPMPVPAPPATVEPGHAASSSATGSSATASSATAPSVASPPDIDLAPDTGSQPTYRPSYSDEYPASTAAATTTTATATTTSADIDPDTVDVPFEHIR